MILSLEMTVILEIDSLTDADSDVEVDHKWFQMMQFRKQRPNLDSDCEAMSTASSEAVFRKAIPIVILKWRNLIDADSELETDRLRNWRT